MFKRFRLSGIGLVLAMVVLTACNFPNPTAQKPTPIAAPTEAAVIPTPDTQIADNSAQCVAGTWEMENIIPFLNANLPREILQGQDVLFTGSNGRLLYKLDPAGTITVSADNFQINATAKVGPINLNGTADIKGSGSGAYTVNEANRTIEITNIADHGFTISASVAGNQIVPETPIDSLIWFGSGNNSTASLAYTCTGNQLSFTFNVAGTSTGPQTVTLVRSKTQ